MTHEERLAKAKQVYADIAKIKTLDTRVKDVEAKTKDIKPAK